MKISDLKPCVSCGGPLRSGMSATWYVVRVSQAMFNPRAANQVLGLTQVFQGALGMAEVFAPAADDAVMIFGDKEPELMTELHICFDCMFKGEGSLGYLLEKVNARKSENEVASS